MSDAKHTPGPWTACFSKMDNEPYEFHVTAPQHGSLLPVCELHQSIDVLSVTEGYDKPYFTVSEVEANANLIAAAPALLAAAILGLEAIDTVLSSHEGQAEHSGLLTAFEHLQSAIAKAEGLE